MNDEQIVALRQRLNDTARETQAAFVADGGRGHPAEQAQIRLTQAQIELLLWVAIERDGGTAPNDALQALGTVTANVLSNMAGHDPNHAVAMFAILGRYIADALKTFAADGPEVVTGDAGPMAADKGH